MASTRLNANQMNLIIKLVGTDIAVQSKDKKIKRDLSKFLENKLNMKWNLPSIMMRMCDSGNFYAILDITRDKATFFPLSGTCRVKRIETEKDITFKIPKIGTLELYKMMHFRLLLNDKNLPYGTRVTQKDISGHLVDSLRNVIISELTRVCCIYLYIMGYNKSDVINFRLSLQK